MKIECGPSDDIRELIFDLPKGNKRLAVFVSGGIDSAILYYMLMKMNSEQNNPHTIMPLTMLRTEGSRLYAKPVINYINSLFGLPPQDLITIGDNTLPEDQQIRSGVLRVFKYSIADIVYIGVIETLDIHMIGWQPIPARETDILKTPFKNLNKSHIIDLAYLLGQEKLIELSHSCIHELGRCNNCNGCNERSWAFTQILKNDIGIL